MPTYQVILWPLSEVIVMDITIRSEELDSVVYGV